MPDQGAFPVRHVIAWDIDDRSLKVPIEGHVSDGPLSRFHADSIFDRAAVLFFSSWQDRIGDSARPPMSTPRWDEAMNAFHDGTDDSHLPFDPAHRILLEGGSV